MNTLNDLDKIEVRYQKLIDEKAKAEAQLDLTLKQFDFIGEELETKYGIKSFDELEELIETKRELLSEMTVKTKERQEKLGTEISAIIDALKV